MYISFSKIYNFAVIMAQRISPPCFESQLLFSYHNTRFKKFINVFFYENAPALKKQGLIMFFKLKSYFTISDLPVISFGCGTSRISSIVGTISARTPPSLSLQSIPVTMKGTTFVV